MKLLCKELGVTVPARTLHSLRHTCALNAIRKGASVFHVQLQLGHSSLEMTKRYVRLQTEDLQKIHHKVSLFCV